MESKDKQHVKDLKNKKLIFRGAQMCMAKDIGLHSNLFGGIMLQYLDETAAILACEVCDTPRMVTKKMEEVVFDRPVKVGQIIKFYGGIENIGNTSITLKIEARQHNVYTEVEKIVCSTKTVFVRIDEEGSPIPISERIKIKFGFTKPKAKNIK